MISGADGRFLRVAVSNRGWPVLYLAEGAEADVVPGGSLSEPALLFLDGLAVTSWADSGSGDYEDYLLRTHGNRWGLWTDGDEFRFNSATGLLESVWMNLPETNLADPGVIAPWLELTPAVGVLRREDKKAFVAAAAEVRWCAEDGSVLVGLHGSAVEPAAELLRLRVTDELDLLFANGRLAGWLMENPERHLHGLEDDTADAQPPDPEFAVLLKHYFDLIDHPHMEELFEEEDPRGHQLLVRLRERIALDRGATRRRSVLSEKIRYLDARWYPGE